MLEDLDSDQSFEKNLEFVNKAISTHYSDKLTFAFLGLLNGLQVRMRFRKDHYTHE